MLQNIRAFFTRYNALEVETPILSKSTITDPHLHSFKTGYLNHHYYLHTSPEFFMKRLLAAGSGDIYQICKVFRDDEQGQNHNPEFTMLEWYRVGFDQQQLMDEIEKLFKTLLKKLDTELSWQSVKRISYQQVFIDVLGIDPLETGAVELKSVTEKNNIEIPIGMDADDRDMWLDWLMTQAIAPSLDKKQFTFLYDYPASQAALAKLNSADPRVAHRFEVYYGELELANGFNELTNAAEQRRRFEEENKKRQQLGLDIIPVDENLLSALEQGIPECSGVAVGLDRLLMVLLGIERIEDVLSFGVRKV